ncbi:MAG: enoyl-CoA hydratase/isomerase family protein, partial [Desulfobacterium sp.]|nr:enoyl-CoA hydratase/isomerase family protein [Desulfobacterium sp.]MBU4036702.1 enoyl-CoA hydratase/isomerase family protein [Pseudomonadota bacterium]
NINGKEAERIGLVNLSVSSELLMETTRNMAKEIVQNSSFSLKMIKKGLNMADEVSMEALMDYEIEACLACVSTKERETSLQDFEERKRT